MTTTRISTLAVAGLCTALLFTPPSEPALAADLGSVVKPNEQSFWHGFYVGAQIGGGFGSSIQSFNDGTTDRYDLSGFNGGGTVGYNLPISRNFVLGIEGDLSAANINGGGVTSASYDCGSGAECSSKIDLFGTVRARAGLAFDNLLIYGSGGYAFADVETTLVDMRRMSTRSGWVAGLGAEHAFAQSWSAKLEFLHFDFSSYVWTNDNAGTVACMDISCSTNAKFNVIRTGLNYRF